MDPFQESKRVAGRAAADLVATGTHIGLGTGSTVRHTLERLGERIADEGLEVAGVPTSEATARWAVELGIELVELESVERLDLAIDGADEVDREKNLIKGGGGALLREKIVAAAADELVVIVGENKMVERLGAFPLPVEVLPFGWRQVRSALTALGAEGELRMRDGERFVTDNGNYVLDCPCGEITDPRALELDISRIPGVVECGLFVGMAGRILIGTAGGEVRRVE